MTHNLKAEIEIASELLTALGKEYPYMLVFGPELQLSLSDCLSGKGINMMLADTFDEEQYAGVTLNGTTKGGQTVSITGVAFKDAADREKLSKVLEAVEPEITVAAVAVVDGKLGPVVQRSPV